MFVIDIRLAGAEPVTPGPGTGGGRSGTAAARATDGLRGLQHAARGRGPARDR